MSGPEDEDEDSLFMPEDLADLPESASPPTPPDESAPYGLTSKGTPRKRPPRPGEGAANRTLLTRSMLGNIARLSRGGLVEREIREALGINTSTWREWHKQPRFLSALDGRCDGVDVSRVERALLHRALGYEHEAVRVMQHKGVPVVVPYVEHYPPDVEAAKLWLTNKSPQRWKVRQPDTTPPMNVIINAPMILDAIQGRDPAPFDDTPRRIPALEQAPTDGEEGK